MKRRRVLVWAGATLLVVLALLLLAFPGLQDFDLSEYETRPLAFTFNGEMVSGTLRLPDADTPPLVLLVHGDGPADRYAGGGYMPLMSALLDNGIAVGSWDKPGVGESGGDWLAFSMKDRADLAAAALEAARSQPGLRMSPAGFAGFSQGGWVVPILAENPAKADFFIIIGGAVNWLRQGAYYTRRRLELEGARPQEIEAALKPDKAANQRLLSGGYSYRDYLADLEAETPMSEARFGFVRRNALADSSENLERISAPVLTLHGSGDLNVDPDYNSSRYRKILRHRNPANRSIVIANGTHALLRAELFNQQLESGMPAWSKTAFVLLGRRAYAPGALETLAGWIKDRTRLPPAKETSENRSN